MFSLSRKKVLETAIRNASLNNISVYKDELIRFMNNQKKTSMSNEEAEEKFAAVRRKYFNAVNSAVISTLKLSDSGIAARAELALLSTPNSFYGIMGGRLFTVVYEILTGRIVEGKICIRINHYQDELLNRVLDEVEQML